MKLTTALCMATAACAGGTWLNRWMHAPKPDDGVGNEAVRFPGLSSLAVRALPSRRAKSALRRRFNDPFLGMSWREQVNLDRFTRAGRHAA